MNFPGRERDHHHVVRKASRLVRQQNRSKESVRATAGSQVSETSYHATLQGGRVKHCERGELAVAQVMICGRVLLLLENLPAGTSNAFVSVR
ncbi:MAG: hypothetical protein ACJ0K4_03740 [Verrucomicrobiales bacterium]